jgi:hypothetical protein
MTRLSDDELDEQNPEPLPPRESVSLSVQGAAATVSDPPGGDASVETPHACD